MFYEFICNDYNFFLTVLLLALVWILATLVVSRQLSDYDKFFNPFGWWEDGD